MRLWTTFAAVIFAMAPINGVRADQTPTLEVYAFFTGNQNGRIREVLQHRMGEFVDRVRAHPLSLRPVPSIRIVGGSDRLSNEADTGRWSPPLARVWGDGGGGSVFTPRGWIDIGRSPTLTRLRIRHNRFFPVTATLRAGSSLAPGAGHVAAFEAMIGYSLLVWVLENEPGLVEPVAFEIDRTLLRALSESSPPRCIQQIARGVADIRSKARGQLLSPTGPASAAHRPAPLIPFPCSG